MSRLLIGVDRRSSAAILFGDGSLPPHAEIRAADERRSTPIKKQIVSVGERGLTKLHPFIRKRGWNRRAIPVRNQRRA